jgi:predicted deacylase
VYLSNTAITRGKPAITTETGGMGVVDHESIRLVEQGVAGVMRHLGMRDDGPALVRSPMMLERTEVLRSGSTGMFFAAVAKSQMVAQGAPIGHVTDFHGKKLEEIRAPFAGEILYVIGTPPITKGEPVAMIGSAK